MLRLIALLAVLALLAAACNGDDPEPTDPADPADPADPPDPGDEARDTIQLGAVMPLSRGQVDRSEATLYGVRAAIAEINANGGIEVAGQTYDFDLSVEDTRGETTAATTAATGLVEDEGIKFIFGPIDSAEMRAVAAVTSREPAMMMVGTSLIAVLGGAGEPAFDYSYSFNLGGHDVFPAYAREAITVLPEATRAAFLLQDDPVGEFFEGIFEEAFAGEGLEVVAKEFYPPEATEFSAQLTTLRAAEPDIVLFGFIPEVAGTILRQGSQLDVAPLFVSPDPYTIATEAEGIENQYLALMGGGSYGEHATTDQRRDFGELLQELNDGAPMPDEAWHFYTAGGYAGVYLIKEAIEAAGTIDDVDAIKSAWEQASVTLPSGDVYEIDPETHHIEPLIDLDATLVIGRDEIRRLTFNPEGTEILNETTIE